MQVANSLAVAFSTEEFQAIEDPPTDSAEAYALYLRVLAAVGGTLPLTAGDAPGLEELLDQALELDPNFALFSEQEAAGVPDVEEACR